MQFVVHKSLFSTELHYLYDIDSKLGQFITDIPADAWVIGSDKVVRSIDMFAQLIREDFTAIPSLQFKIFESLGVNTNVPWQLAMPKEHFRAHLVSTLDSARCILNNGYRHYYETIFITSREFLESLSGLYVNRQLLNRHLETEQSHSVISALTTCIPDECGITRPVMYDLVNSKTGRFTVRSGPHVLTLKRQYRDIFVSEWPDGCIVPIDYKSLEARIALALGGQTGIANDPYQCIADKTGVERDIAKKAMLSIMFGSSMQNVADITKLTQLEVAFLVAHIKDSIVYDATVERLQNEYAETGRIHNFYGRPLWPGTDAGHVLYNNYIQSTGVDVVMLGFSKMVQHIKQKEFLIRPKFIVHDCLYIDIHREYNLYIEELQSVGSMIPDIDAYFYSSLQ